MKKYHRVLVKISGEALLGNVSCSDARGIDHKSLDLLSKQVRQLVEEKVQVALVIGAGNFFRGTQLATKGVDRATADYMGMLATVINALAMQDVLEAKEVSVRVMSAIRIREVCEDYIRRRAIRHMEQGRVVIFAAGTGNPFFTTDSAASLRAIEINAELLIKATKVDGVFSADPKKHPDATRYQYLNYDEVLLRKLAVMDATAIVLCRDHNIPLRVIDMNRDGALLRTVLGEDEGTFVGAFPTPMPIDDIGQELDRVRELGKA
uniref:Uridylate kinase n=1 Tax=Candidatus Kentrum sp. LFY TaxID=2126342 RepID=A0A450WX57_9GAMM|nr:MAG: uridylate kinase [Candidatus Kentron sp. LFY]VFJ97515.1 MAG: uridylate kinase [Candidatus Kentron sp. LFY]VFK21608.1 MAG: uridylate kinase [Candidatus Kentron sp. LFY]